MNNHEWLMRIVHGQAKLDQMKHEIVTVINVVMGALRQLRYSCEDADIHKELDLGDLCWKISMDSCVSKAGAWLVQCRGSDNKELVWYGFGYKADNRTRLPTPNHVELVHDSLSKLIRAILTDFPAVRAELQPYINASKKEF